jgi:hypothetical protein
MCEILNRSPTPEPTTPHDGSLLEILSTTPNSNPHIAIRQILTHLQPETQLNLLLELIDAASDHSQIINEAVVAAWKYLIDTNVWKHRYQSLMDLQVAVQWQDNVKPIIDTAQKLSRRQAGAYATIYENWGTTPTEAFPSNIRPPNVSTMMAREMARFSGICSKDEAMRLIRNHIKLRLTQPGRRLAHTVMTNDIRQAYEEFNPPYREPESSSNVPVNQLSRTIPHLVETIPLIPQRNPSQPSVAVAVPTPSGPQDLSNVAVVMPFTPPLPRQIISMVLVHERADFPREQYVSPTPQYTHPIPQYMSPTPMQDIQDDGNSQHIFPIN